MTNYVEGTLHTEVLVAYAQARKREGLRVNYLEIGVRYAPTFNAMLPHCDEAYGVDIEDVASHMHGGTFYHGSSDEFFQELEDTCFDIVFVDGLHEYAQVKADFWNAWHITEGDGMIALHDTWPAEGDGCGTVWRFRNELDTDEFISSFTFTTFPGLTLVRR